MIGSIDAGGPVNRMLALVRVDEQGPPLTLALGPALAEQAQPAALKT